MLEAAINTADMKSRLAHVIEASCFLIDSLNKDQSEVKVGIITFGNTIQVIGDGYYYEENQQENVLQRSILDNVKELIEYAN